MRFRPRSIGLDALDRASVTAWEKTADEKLGPPLDDDARERVAQRILEMWSLLCAEPFVEEPVIAIDWREEFEPVPSYRFTRVRIAEVGWHFLFTAPDPLAEVRATEDDHWLEPFEGALSVTREGERIVLENDLLFAEISPRLIDLGSNDQDGFDESFGDAIVQVSGFACARPRGYGLDRSTVHLAFEALACAACGREETSGSYGAVACDCGSTAFVHLSPSPAAPDDADAPRRLASALIESGAIEVDDVEAVANLLASCAPADVFDRLIALPEVRDIYVDAEVLAILVEAW